MAANPKNTCGAKTSRSGSSCKNPAGYGTDHLGSGRCKWHGGASTGAKTEEGKATSAQNSRKHGLYAKILDAKDQKRLEETHEFAPDQILRDNFYLVQARMLGLLENESKFEKEARTLFQACAILVENQEISPEFVDDLRSILHPLDTHQLCRVLNSTTNLARAGEYLSEAGQICRQLDISKKLIVDILKSTNDKETRLLALDAVEKLKLDAGLPVEQLDTLLVELNETTEDEVSELPITDK